LTDKFEFVTIAEHGKHKSVLADHRQTAAAEAEGYK
jgi:hypothetical protein